MAVCGSSGLGGTNYLHGMPPLHCRTLLMVIIPVTVLSLIWTSNVKSSYDKLFYHSGLVFPQFKSFFIHNLCQIKHETIYAVPKNVDPKREFTDVLQRANQKCIVDSLFENMKTLWN